MKTSELAGAELDYWVAKAEGHEATFNEHRCVVHTRADGLSLGQQGAGWVFNPSTYWRLGGPIIEREGIGLLQIGVGDATEKWSANFEYWHEDRDDPWTGPTALVAAMRAFVGSKFGVEIEDKP